MDPPPDISDAGRTTGLRRAYPPRARRRPQEPLWLPLAHGTAVASPFSRFLESIKLAEIETGGVMLRLADEHPDFGAVAPPSTQLMPSLSNSYRRLLIDFGLLWLREHAKSIEDVQVAERHKLSRAVGDGQTQHHALGHLRSRMGAA